MITTVANNTSARLQPTAWSLVQWSLVWNHHYDVTKGHDVITSVLYMSFLLSKTKNLNAHRSIPRLSVIQIISLSLHCPIQCILWQVLHFLTSINYIPMVFVTSPRIILAGSCALPRLYGVPSGGRIASAPRISPVWACAPWPWTSTPCGWYSCDTAGWSKRSWVARKKRKSQCIIWRNHFKEQYLFSNSSIHELKMFGLWSAPDLIWFDLVYFCIFPQ